MATLVTLLEAAFHAYVRGGAERRQGRPGRVWQRDVDRFLDEIIPEVLNAGDGRDGRVLWMLAILAFIERRDVIEAALLQVVGDLPPATDRGVLWRRFRNRVLLSPAALDWGELERCCRAARSSRFC